MLGSKWKRQRYYRQFYECDIELYAEIDTQVDIKPLCQDIGIQCELNLNECYSQLHLHVLLQLKNNQLYHVQIEESVN